jgi:hypothetical protein
VTLTVAYALSAAKLVNSIIITPLTVPSDSIVRVGVVVDSTPTALAVGGGVVSLALTAGAAGGT